MNAVKKLLFGILIFSGCCLFSEEGGKATVYTICQRKICSSFQTTESYATRNNSGYYEPTEEFLLNVYDALRDYLYKDLDLTKCNNDSYRLDELVFSFYEYYLQFIPYYEKDKKMIFVNAYRRGYDKAYDRSDESPAKRIVSVRDGGSNFWSVFYDVEENKFIGLKISGP